jgi:hypothetical protein
VGAATEQGEAEQVTDWAAMITAASSNRPAAVSAVTFLKRRSSASQPVDVRCSDSNIYVLKALRNDVKQGRMMFNDHIVARLGAMIGAPVPAAALVTVSQELIDLNPDKAQGMGHIQPCTAHGSRLYAEVSERIDNIDHIADDDNKGRFASLGVLHGWMGFSDRQFIYDNAQPFRVYSVDHGHFFPGGPEWTIASLQAAPAATIADDIVKSCKLDHGDLVLACSPLRTITEAQIAEILGIPMDDWDVGIDDRVALGKYLRQRQLEILATYAQQIKQAGSS